MQPTAEYMRLVKDRVLAVWQKLKSDVCERVADVDRRAKAIQQKLDRLLESISDGFIVLDDQWRYRFVNDQAAHLMRRLRACWPRGVARSRSLKLTVTLRGSLESSMPAFASDAATPAALTASTLGWLVVMTTGIKSRNGS